MEFENICKWNFNRSSDLVCLNFIYETNDPLRDVRPSERHILALAVNGSGIYKNDENEYTVSEGTLFFVTEGTHYSICSTNSLKYYYISFYGRRADEYLERLHINGENCVFQGRTDLIPFWQQCQSLAEDGNIDILCEAVLLYSLATLKPCKKEDNDVVSKMITLTQKNFSNADLSLSTLAETLRYDAKYLSSLFKKQRGINYMQYLRDLRIRHALFLMNEGVASVKNVALLCGFRDALYFSKVFTAQEGISPKAYIQKISSQ